MFKKIIFTNTALPQNIMQDANLATEPGKIVTINPWIGSADDQHDTMSVFCISVLSEDNDIEKLERAINMCYASRADLSFNNIATMLIAMESANGHFQPSSLLNTVLSFRVENEFTREYISIENSILNAETDEICFDLSPLSPEQKRFFIVSYVFGCAKLSMWLVNGSDGRYRKKERLQFSGNNPDYDNLYELWQADSGLPHDDSDEPFSFVIECTNEPEFMQTKLSAASDLAHMMNEPDVRRDPELSREVARCIDDLANRTRPLPL